MIPHTLDILKTLIAFDTTSSKSNRALIDWVAAYLAERGIPHWLVESTDGAKANLLARIGPEVEGGILLSGHSDVVPVDGQPWTSDPWALTQKGGKLYGRGVCDMKGFIALSLALIDTLDAATLQRPLMLAITYDEEVGCLGAPHLLAQLTALVPRLALAIIGERGDGKRADGEILKPRAARLRHGDGAARMGWRRRQLPPRQGQYRHRERHCRHQLYVPQRQ